MDCRKGLWLALGLWGTAAGCHSPQPYDPTVTTSKGGAVVAPVEPVASGKKPKTTPEMCVAFGDYRVQESCTSGYNPNQQERLREEARGAYTDALKLDANCVAAHKGLARLYANGEDYTRAVATYEKALKQAPKDPSLWFELGMCHNRTQEWDKAIKEIHQAVDLAPDNKAYANTLGVVLARVGKYDESLACFARVNGEAQAHYCLGCTLHKLNQPDLSRQHLAAALHQNPRLESARALLAEMGPPRTQATAAQPIQPVQYTTPQAPPSQPQGEPTNAPAEGHADENVPGPVQGGASSSPLDPANEPPGSGPK
jgi:Tfp pilus assembly protein PilF